MRAPRWATISIQPIAVYVAMSAMLAATMAQGYCCVRAARGRVLNLRRTLVLHARPSGPWLRVNWRTRCVRWREPSSV